MEAQKVKIELNAQEAQVLVNLLNIACQAKGLEAAESCVHFKAKIDTAIKALPAVAEVPAIAPEKVAETPAKAKKK